MAANQPRIRSLLHQASRVAENGKRAAAEQLYRQILAEAPDTAVAWLGLAGVVRDPEEQEQAYQQVLALEPDNKDAQTGLARLRGEPIPDVFPTEEVAQTELEASEPIEEVIPEPVPMPPPEKIVDAPDLTFDKYEQPVDAAIEDAYEVACYRHPTLTTSLRCYTCGKPICIKCANKTPVGYSCPDCLRDKEKDFYTASPIDYVVALFITLPVSIIAASIATRIGFFVIFIAPVVGNIIGRIVFFVIRRRRGRYLPHLVAGTVALGALLAAALPFLTIMFLSFFVSPEQSQSLLESGGGFLLSGGISLLWAGIYAVLAAGAAYFHIKV